VSAERIRQIENNAFNTMKRALNGDLPQLASAR